MKLDDGKYKSKLFYIAVPFISLINLTCNPMIEHLNKRGIFTNYWVINDKREINHILKKTKV